jgi:hypothetical protein
MSYRYQSAARLLFKDRWKLEHLVEDHHVIPRHLQHHKVLRELAFDINASKNLVMMPTAYAMDVYHEFLRPNRLVHGVCSHRAYNEFVKKELDKIVDPHKEFWVLHNFLKRNCRDNVDGIPWCVRKN